MHLDFKFRGKYYRVDPTTMIRLAQRALAERKNPFSRSERQQIALLLEQIVYATAAMIKQYEEAQIAHKGDSEALHPALLGQDGMLFDLVMPEIEAQKTVAALRRVERFRIDELLPNSEYGGLVVQVVGPVAVYYESEGEARVRAFLRRIHQKTQIVEVKPDPEPPLPPPSEEKDTPK